jgi:hypothetical protein
MCATGVLIADGGCVLETLMQHVEKEEHILPFDLGAKGRRGFSFCTITTVNSTHHQLSNWRKYCN